MRWSISTFESGTYIVTRNLPRRPHYYVYAGVGMTRYETCEGLRDWLNGETERPRWLDGMMRSTPSSAAHPNGLKILAVGPHVDADPPKCNWTEDPDPSCVAEREHMIDVLLEE